MIEAIFVALTFGSALIGYVIGHSEGYSKGRRDGWMHYDSIVSNIQDECDRLKRAAELETALASAPADGWKLVPVEPQPTFIESSGRWSWDLPEHCRYPGCSHNVVTASREWWEYAPSEAKPHPMAEGVMLRDGMWYWAIAAAPTDGSSHD